MPVRNGLINCNLPRISLLLGPIRSDILRTVLYEAVYYLLPARQGVPKLGPALLYLIITYMCLSIIGAVGVRVLYCTCAAFSNGATVNYYRRVPRSSMFQHFFHCFLFGGGQNSLAPSRPGPSYPVLVIGVMMMQQPFYPAGMSGLL